uniref:Aminopeptidase n=1 Tax=Culicoides sonorensis TaxID=179676 RepID=A0A336M9D9_CULSO
MLNSRVKPSHYDLTFKPNVKTFEFDGKVVIDVKILEETDTITLHSLKLIIQESLLRFPDKKEIYPKETKFNEDDETVSLHFPSPISPGTAQLEMQFIGELNDKLKGFYRSKYFVDGDERYAFVTQFAPTDGRRCFPSWDEPALKATFDITLIVPKNLTALSNMPVISEFEESNGLKVLKFDRTPVMSTYLVAMVIGEFDYVEQKSDDGVLCRVYTPLGKKEHGMFALDAAVRVLPYYKNYFGIGYPLKKLDLIAIADFALGAMENWGLITFTETRILVDPLNTSLSIKQMVAMIVAHEISHQWFGNLVTMEWWTHLWLNEGFATFMQFLATDFLYPEYQIWSQFVSGMYAAALQLDSLKNSHPIEVPVKNSSEIDEIFDAISYNKGASIIRMLHAFIGDTDFRKGMKLYLTRHKYGNTETSDLWKALSEGSNKPVTEMMSNWVEKIGFPLVSVVKTVENDGKRTLTLKQERFIADGSKSDDQVTWMIPLNISTASNETATSVIFDKETIEITLENVSQSDWIKINPGTVGFYRTQYLPEMLNDFENHKVIENKILSPLDRLGLLDDLFALVNAGKVKTVDYLKFLMQYTNETEYVVWRTISSNISKLRTLLSHTDYKPLFDKFCQKLFAGILSTLKWEASPSDNHSDTLLRPLIITQLIEAGCQETISEAKSRFDNQSVPIPADLRQAVYKGVLFNADSMSLQKIIELYRKTSSQEEKERIYFSLGVLDDSSVIHEALDFVMSSDVRSAESARAVGAIAGSGNGREITWNYFKKNIKIFQERFGEGTYIMPRMIQNLTENFASSDKMNEIEEFFKVHKFSGIDRTIQQSLETIKLNEAWLGRDSKEIKAYLENLI